MKPGVNLDESTLLWESETWEFPFQEYREGAVRRAAQCLVRAW